jgi:hypothetical protein
MFIDSRLEFSDAQSIISTASTAVTSTYSVDTGSITRDLCCGEPLYLVVTVDTAVTAASAGTLKIDFVSSAASALSGATTHASVSLTTATTASAANLTSKGSIAWVLALPCGLTYLRYIGVIYTPVTAATTAGKLNAFLTKEPIGIRAYPDAL